MKTIEIKNIILLLACTALAACEADPVESESGTLPDKEALETVSGKLRCGAFPGQEVNVMLAEGDGSVMSNFYFQQTASATDGISLNVQVGSPDGERQMLPESNYEFPDGKNLELSQGHVRSDIKRIKFIASGLDSGEYVLPLTIAETHNQNEQNTLYYNISVCKPHIDYLKPVFGVLTPTDLELTNTFFCVYYVNTSKYSPLIASDYIFQNISDMSEFLTGHIINLRPVLLDYDEGTKRAVLNLGSDITYVLGNAVKYIWPLQEQGRKVCISIEGGGKGLGFCNLTDEQREDFVAQVKTVVEKYGIDGVNLWDRNSGYGTDGMPNTNTTSYPKLIKALREALGTEKLLTVTVYDKPTETFYDPEACGGIAVGDYIDYAWSGYMLPEYDELHLLDPWHPEESYVSEYTQKPIANLPKEKFGCIHFQLEPLCKMLNNTDIVKNWVAQGYNPNNILVVSDLRTNLQDAYEAIWDFQLTNLFNNFDPQSMLMDGGGSNMYVMSPYIQRYYDEQQGGYNTGYGKWLKDW